MLSVELDSLRSELDTLTDLSGQLVSVSGQQEASKLDQVISDLTTEWQLTTDQCKVSLQQVDSAVQQSSVFNDQLAVCTLYKNSLLFYHQLCTDQQPPYLNTLLCYRFIFRSGADLISLVLVFVLVGATSSRKA